MFRQLQSHMLRMMADIYNLFGLNVCTFLWEQIIPNHSIGIFIFIHDDVILGRTFPPAIRIRTDMTDSVVLIGLTWMEYSSLRSLLQEPVR